MATILKLAKGFFLFTIPIPAIAIIAIFTWLQVDKNSQIRQLVNSKVERFIAGEKITSLENQVKANAAIAELWKMIYSARTKQLVLEEQARAKFEEAMIISDQENFALQENLNEVQKLKSQCSSLSDDLYDRLQYK